MRILAILGGVLCALGLAPAAHAQLASPPVFDASRPRIEAGTPPPSKSQDLDISNQSTQSTLEVITATQTLRTMVKPAKPQIVQCDPRTLPDAQRNAREAMAPPRPNELVLGRQGMAVVTGDIYFSGTSDGTPCPQIGQTMVLPPAFNEVQR